MRKSNLTIHQLILLRQLYSSAHGLSAFTLFKKFRGSFSDYLKVMNQLESKEMIEKKEEYFFTITKLGFETVLFNKKLKEDKSWRAIPSEFLNSTPLKSDFYIPSVNLLDEKAFKNH